MSDPKEKETDESKENSEESIEESNKDSEEVAEESSTDEQIDEKNEDREEELEKKLKEFEDRYLRTLAEHENFKKRSRQDVENHKKFASLPLGEGLISGLDDLERALEHVKADSENHSEQMDEFIKGIDMIFRQFLKNLEDNHYTRIEAKGEKFNPEKHEAIGVVETDEVEDGHVANVFKVGYSLHDRIIRPAMVQVAKSDKAKESNE